MNDIDIEHIRGLVEMNSRDLAFHVPALLAEVEDVRSLLDHARAERDHWFSRVSQSDERARKAEAQVQAVRALADEWDEEAGDYVPPLPADAAWTVMRDHVAQVRAALDAGSDT